MTHQDYLRLANRTLGQYLHECMELGEEDLQRAIQELIERSEHTSMVLGVHDDRARVER